MGVFQRRGNPHPGRVFLVCFLNLTNEAETSHLLVLEVRRQRWQAQRGDQLTTRLCAVVHWRPSL